MGVQEFMNRIDGQVLIPQVSPNDMVLGFCDLKKYYCSSENHFSNESCKVLINIMCIHYK